MNLANFVNKKRNQISKFMEFCYKFHNEDPEECPLEMSEEQWNDLWDRWCSGEFHND